MRNRTVWAWMAVLLVAALPAGARPPAPTRDSATAATLPAVLRGDWFEDNHEGQAACVRFRAAPTGDGAVVGMLRIEAGKFSELAEYGEGNGYVLTAVTASGAHRWQTRSLLSIDGESPGGSPVMARFDLVDDRLRLTYAEDRSRGFDPADAKVYARCR